MTAEAVGTALLELPLFFAPQHVRSGPAQMFSEFVATFGLLAVIRGCTREWPAVVVPFAVAGYITAAYRFTASTSFANPAVPLARSASDTFAGIRPADAPGFMAQMTSEPVLMSRAVAGHAASIGVAGAISFVFAGTIGRWLGWRGARRPRPWPTRSPTARTRGR